MKKDKICKIKLCLSFKLMNNTKHFSNEMKNFMKNFIQMNKRGYLKN